MDNKKAKSAPLEKTEQRIKNVMADLGLDIPDIVRLSDGRIKQATLWRILNGVNNASIKTLEQLSRVLNVPMGYFMGFDTIPEETRPTDQALHQRVPLISWHDAGKHRKDIEPKTIISWLYSPEKISSSGYALQVDGESMTPIFQQGDIIFVDPEAKAKAGKFIVAKLKSGAREEVILRKFIQEGSDTFLMFTNKEWPGNRYLPLSDEIEVLGVVSGKYLPL